jgi:hypothetical protein
MNRREFVLLAALAAASPAHGEDMVIFANGANGITIITDQPCKQGGLITKGTNATGSVLTWGCSLHISGDIAKIHWNDGEETYFNWNWGTPTDAFLKRVNKATSQAPVRQAIKAKAYSSPYYDNN